MGFQRQWTVLLCVSDCPLLNAYPFPRHALAQHATSVRYDGALMLQQQNYAAHSYCQTWSALFNRNVVKLQTYVDPRKHRATSTPRAVSCTRPERWYVDVLSMVRQFVMNGSLMLQKNFYPVHILLSILVMPAYIVTVVKLQPSASPWNNHGRSCAMGYSDHLNCHGTYRSGCNAMGIQEPRNPGIQESGNPKIQESRNPDIQDSGNPGIWVSSLESV